eukprot:2705278-Prymnesium_polylepis.1
MSNVDVALQIHFALFKGSAGYVLKPPEMRGKSLMDEAGRRSSASASRRSSLPDELSPRTSRWNVVNSLRVSHVNVARASHVNVDDDSRDSNESEPPHESEPLRESEPQSPRNYGHLRTTSPVRMAPDERDSESSEAIADHDEYWPPPCEKLYCTTLHIFSLHNIPKVTNTERSIQTQNIDRNLHVLDEFRLPCHARPSPPPTVPLVQRGEQRPRYDGSREQCHTFVKELSGRGWVLPNDSDPSSPSIGVSLHPVGGDAASLSIERHRPHLISPVGYPTA